MAADAAGAGSERVVCIGIVKELPAAPAAVPASTNSCNSCQLSFRSEDKLKMWVNATNV